MEELGVEERVGQKRDRGGGWVGLGGRPCQLPQGKVECEQEDRAASCTGWIFAGAKRYRLCDVRECADPACNICVCSGTYVSVCVCVCLNVSECVRVCMCVHVCVGGCRAEACICRLWCVCLYAHTHTHTHTYTHAHTHTACRATDELARAKGRAVRAPSAAEGRMVWPRSPP